MKQLNLTVFILTLIALCSCNTNDEIKYSETDLANLEKIKSAKYYTFHSKEEVLSESSVLNSTQVETMLDVENRLNTYLETGIVDEGYEAIASEYADILEVEDDGEYKAIIYSPKLSGKINSNGVLGINDSVYVYSKDVTYKYLYKNNRIVLIETFDHTATSLKGYIYSYSGNKPFYIYNDWEPNYKKFTRSGRRVKVYGYLQRVDDFGFIIGSKTKYYDKYLGNYHLTNRIPTEYSMYASVKAYANVDDTSMESYYFNDANNKTTSTKSISFTEAGAMSRGIYLSGMEVHFKDNKDIDLEYTLVGTGN